jgi:hypothetical protein
VLNALKRNVKASALKRQNARKTARIRRIARKIAKSNATAKRKTARSNAIRRKKIAARNNSAKRFLDKYKGLAPRRWTFHLYTSGMSDEIIGISLDIFG